MMEEEVWKDIDEYEGYYQVSTMGRIRSLDRTIESGQGWTVNRKGKILKTHLSGAYRNYPAIRLMKNGVKINHRVHRLVAAAFIPNPENKPEVNHIDGNTENNHVTNLEWCTAKENINHAFENGLYPERKGRDCPNTKWIYHVYLEGVCVADLCGTEEIKRFGLQSSKVLSCCKGERTQHKGYTFKRTRYEK